MIPNRLKMYRRKKQLSQKEAAQKLGLKSSSALSRWEKGVATPNLIHLGKLILLYNAPFELLYTDFLENIRQ